MQSTAGMVDTMYVDAKWLTFPQKLLEIVRLWTARIQKDSKDLSSSYCFGSSGFTFLSLEIANELFGIFHKMDSISKLCPVF